MHGFKAIGIGGLLAVVVAGCSVGAAQPPAKDASSGSDCKAQQNQCVARCKAAVPDVASRQPCMTNCLRNHPCS